MHFALCDYWLERRIYEQKEWNAGGIWLQQRQAGPVSPKKVRPGSRFSSIRNIGLVRMKLNVGSGIPDAINQACGTISNRISVRSKKLWGGIRRELRILKKPANRYALCSMFFAIHESRATVLIEWFDCIDIPQSAFIRRPALCDIWGRICQLNEPREERSNHTNVGSLIITIRNQKVIVDRDLAEINGWKHVDWMNR